MAHNVQFQCNFPIIFLHKLFINTYMFFQTTSRIFFDNTFAISTNLFVLQIIFIYLYFVHVSMFLHFYAIESLNY